MESTSASSQSRADVGGADSEAAARNRVPADETDGEAAIASSEADSDIEQTEVSASEDPAAKDQAVADARSDPAAAHDTGAGGQDAKSQQTHADPESRIVRPREDIEVDPDKHIVRLDGFVCVEAGWLEQIACSPNTREYEALVVLPQPASLVHAAMLMAGFEAGSPGGWSYNQEADTFDFIQPRGSKVRIEFEYMRDGELVRDPVHAWVRDHMRRHAFPDEPWIFAGSVWAENNAWMREQTGEDEHYVADMTGSIIGLVTFGDEVIGYSRVLSDDATLQPPEWEVNTARLPEIGTPVTVIISPWDARPESH